MFKPKETLTSEEVEKGLKALTKQGLATQVKLTITEGVFLVAFALALQAPNTVIGILAAIPYIAQLLQVPSIYLVERYRNRRLINFTTTLGSRITILLMALIPFIASGEVSILALLLLVGAQAAFVALGSPSWNSLLRDIVPQERMGQFFSYRMALQAIIAVIFTVLGGYFVGYWLSSSPSTAVYAYSTLFFLAFLIGLISVYYISMIPEPKMMAVEKRVGFSDLLASPYKDDNFRNLMIFSAIWTFSTSLVGPFFTVYLLVQLQLELPIATGVAAITQMMSILFLRYWGKLADRFTNKSVLLVAVPLFVIGTFLWIFTIPASRPGSEFVTIPLLIIIHILTGISSAGVNLTTNNIGLKLAPRGEATSYLAAKGIVVAVAGAFASIAGGLLADLFAGQILTIQLEWQNQDGMNMVFNLVPIESLDFLFIIAIIIGIYSLHRLAFVKEIGEVDQKVVIEAILAETRRNVKTLSTVDGLRHTFQLPVGTKRKKPKKSSFE
ncbi:MAG: MFS transporter [Candidatus Thorarchaeota archaeon]